ncbi:MAG: hypothetical protein V4471_07075 [Pseudomonadota bacterium]
MPLPVLTMQDYLDRNFLTSSQVEDLQDDIRTLLLTYDVYNWVSQGRLTIDQVLGLTKAAVSALIKESVRNWVNQGRLTMDQVLGLTLRQSASIRMSLQDEAVRNWVDQGRLTMGQVLELSISASMALRQLDVRNWVDEGKLTMDQVLGLTEGAGFALSQADVRNWIIEGRLTMAQVLGLTTAAGLALSQEGIRNWVDEGRLTMDQVFGLTEAAAEALDEEDIRNWVIEGRLTMDQVLGLTEIASLALYQEDMRNWIIEGRLTMDQVLRLVDDNQLQVLRHNILLNNGVAVINDNQSTHRASVHQSVSESATRLANRYPSIISDKTRLKEIIEWIEGYVNNLPDNFERNKAKAAKNCIVRITNSYTFIEPISKVSIQELLALFWSAIHDDANRVGSLEDAKKQLIDGLYEIQRGDNLSDTGVDLGGFDRPICPAGTFNKLIEKLQGIHPDCEIQFITNEIFSLKLRIVTCEEAMRYLEASANPNTAEELSIFTRLMAQIQKEGVGVIWDHIQANITNRMTDEFGSFYEDKSFFMALIEAGQYANLPDLNCLKQHVQLSKGYQHYCSIVMRDKFGMFSHGKAADYLSEHRHDSPEAQQAYDKQFGLIPIK